MKRCPACNRTYDESMSFCLEDGSRLSAPTAPQPTIASQLPPPTLIAIPDTTAKYPIKNSEHLRERPARRLWPPVLFVLLTLGAIAVVAFVWLHRNNSTASASVSSPTPNVNATDDVLERLKARDAQNNSNNGNANNSGNSNVSTTGELPIPKVYGKSYDAARRILIKSGWIPNKQEGIHGSDVETQSGNGPIFWQRGYWELDSCSGTGAAHCKFEFLDPSQRMLVIITEGEEDPDGTYHATVSRVFMKK
jgi:hypothetical protein